MSECSVSITLIDFPISKLSYFFLLLFFNMIKNRKFHLNSKKESQTLALPPLPCWLSYSLLWASCFNNNCKCRILDKSNTIKYCNINKICFKILTCTTIEVGMSYDWLHFGLDDWFFVSSKRIFDFIICKCHMVLSILFFVETAFLLLKHMWFC